MKINNYFKLARLGLTSFAIALTAYELVMLLALVLFSVYMEHIHAKLVSGCSTAARFWLDLWIHCPKLAVCLNLGVVFAVSVACVICKWELDDLRRAERISKI